jgi:hypothetical protein
MPEPAFSHEEQVAFLNRMLEAERAGANALLTILEQHPPRSEAWAALRRVHADEAHNCVLLGKQIQRLGADYSHATGDFLGKLLAVEGPRARRVPRETAPLGGEAVRRGTAAPGWRGAGHDRRHARVTPAQHRELRIRRQDTRRGRRPLVHLTLSSPIGNQAGIFQPIFGRQVGPTSGQSRPGNKRNSSSAILEYCEGWFKSRKVFNQESNIC